MNSDLVTRTIEECAEVIHILCKVQRFGWHSYHPEDKHQTPNYQLVLNEIKDVENKITALKTFINNNVVPQGEKI